MIIKNFDGKILFEDEKTDLAGVDLYEANLRGADLRGADLRGADLTGADLIGATLYGANLYGANFYEADLTRAYLYEANLTWADLHFIFIYGSKHICQYNRSTGELRIGCLVYHIEYWLLMYDTIGSEAEYTEEQIKEYHNYMKHMKEM